MSMICLIDLIDNCYHDILGPDQRQIYDFGEDVAF